MKPLVTPVPIVRYTRPKPGPPQNDLAQVDALPKAGQGGGMNRDHQPTAGMPLPLASNQGLEVKTGRGNRI
ncbi:hypothetical protein [Nocardia sp. NRRL S-836]|uniref:hypothetical protein n=1 Tax=Nocardia sp. NRRL S-836 TaxID=1519492 RepID=UPI0012F7D131|nr:hypothetical protein [Nocardia sp. NRRL S-836]